MVYVNFSEPILMPPGNSIFIPDENISAFFLSKFDLNTQKYDVNIDFIPKKKIGRRLAPGSMMTREELDALPFKFEYVELNSTMLTIHL